MAIPTRGEVLELFEEGVASIESLAAGFEDWHSIACGHWSAADLARHLAAVAAWYHEWLDRAVAGDSSPPFGEAELSLRNERMVEAAAGVSGPDAIKRFSAAARSYAERLDSRHWDLPFGYPFGTVTAGLHAGAAAAEWHLHAWDLGGARGIDHRPSDPAALWRAIGWCRASSRPSPIRLIQGLLVEAGAAGDPWPRLLRASGRRFR